MRQGLRSGNRSDDPSEELENLAPLSSLLPKKKKKKKKKKRPHLLETDAISDTEVLGSVRKKLKRNRWTAGSLSLERNSPVQSTSLQQDEIGSKTSRLGVFDYNEDDLVDYKKFKESLESKHQRVVDDAEQNPAKTVNNKRLLLKTSKGAHVSPKVDSEQQDDTSITSASDPQDYSDGQHNQAQGNRSTTSAVTSIKKRTRSIVQSKDSIENLQPHTVAQNYKSSAKKKKSHHIRGSEKEASLLQGSQCLDPWVSEQDESNKGQPSLTNELHLSTQFTGTMKRKMVKQLIRDQIRSMVESAGWKIDYRPRKSRESYNDAVYIDHSGIVYWSILRAYYGLKKQYDNKESSQKPHGTSFSFTPIPKLLLDQLKRRTKKAIAREQMVKRKATKRNHNTKFFFERKSAAEMHVKKITSSSMSREKLGSLIPQGGKLLKMRMTKKGRKNVVRRPTSTHNSDKVGNGMKSLESSKASRASTANSLQGRKSKTQRGYTLLVRKSDKSNSDGDDLMSYTRKRTVLSWLIDSETVPVGGKIKYMNKRRTRALLEGTITRDGINCGCCTEIVTIAEFQTHAGRKLCQPCQNIFVESGVSLFQCLIDAWNKQVESKRSKFHYIDISTDDPNDDACGICGDGGDLICCDGCPSTFHQSCLGIQVLPKGDWHCFNCCCKFCGIVDCTNGQGNGATISNLLTCSLCEEKYHGSCILQKTNVPVASDVLCGSFCGQKCKELFEKLQKLLGIKHELEAGFSWILIQRSDLESDTSFCTYSQKVECNSKLALALSVMEECFLPTIDERSGINLIQNVVYNCGSNFNRLNYSGFYTFLLERGDELISVASIRIHRASLAEMPFIGTRHIYRRQGMCRRLLNAIESALSSLNLEKLIIPAISELMDTWTRIFGFIPFEESYKHELRSLNLVVFPGVALLQKLLMKPNSVTINDGLGSKANKFERDNHLTTAATDSSDSGSVMPDNISNNVTINPTNERIDEVVVAKTGLQATGDLIQSTSDASNTSDATGELVSHVSKEEAECSNTRSRHEFEEETNSISLKVEKNPNSVEPNPQIYVGDEADKKPHTKMDGITAETSSLYTIDLNEALEMHAPERESECYTFQPQDESSTFITETNVLLHEVKETLKKTSVRCNSHDSIEDAANNGKEVDIKIDGVEKCKSHDSVEDAANNGKEVNIKIHGVEKALHSSVEISARCTSDVQLQEMHCPKVDTECHISQSQDEFPLIELENEHSKCSHGKSSVSDFSADVFSNVQELNMIIDGVESNVSASDVISDQCTLDVINHSLMHPSKEDSQSRDESSMMENKPAMSSSAGPNLGVSTNNVVVDCLEINIQNNGAELNIQTLAESSLQCETEGPNARLSTVGCAVCQGSNSKLNSDTSYQNMVGMEHTSLEVSFAKIRETHEEIICNASDEVTKHGEKAVALENGVNAILDHATGTVSEPQLAAFVPNHLGPGENATCLKIVTKCNSEASLETECNSEASFEIQDAQSLQQSESDCNASTIVDSFCEATDKVDVMDLKHECTGCDSLSCIPKVVNRSVCIKCKFLASVECKEHNFPLNTCNTSAGAVVHHASEQAHKNTYHLADEPLVAFSDCTSDLEDSANGHMTATHEEVSLDSNNLVLSQVFPRDSHDTVTVPITQISSRPGCISLLLKKAPDTVCDTAENITSTYEVNETNAAASDEISVHGASAVL